METKNTLNNNKVVLLEGKATILGQIKARNKGLFYCLQPNTEGFSDSQRQAWIDMHLLTLKKLYALAKRHGIKVKP